MEFNWVTLTALLVSVLALINTATQVLQLRLVKARNQLMMANNQLMMANNQLMGDLGSIHYQNIWSSTLVHAETFPLNTPGLSTDVSRFWIVSVPISALGPSTFSSGDGVAEFQRRTSEWMQSCDGTDLKQAEWVYEAAGVVSQHMSRVRPLAESFSNSERTPTVQELEDISNAFFALHDIFRTADRYVESSESLAQEIILQHLLVAAQSFGNRVEKLFENLPKFEQRIFGHGGTRALEHEVAKMESKAGVEEIWLTMMLRAFCWRSIYALCPALPWLSEYEGTSFAFASDDAANGCRVYLSSFWKQSSSITDRLFPSTATSTDSASTSHPTTLP